MSIILVNLACNMRRISTPILFIVIFWLAFPHVSYGLSEKTQQAEFRPIVLDGVRVYPSRFVSIETAWWQQSRWLEIRFPEGIPLGSYYVEVWDQNNRPLPGYRAEKMMTSILDVSAIDATQASAIRVVLFQPQGQPDLQELEPAVVRSATGINWRLFLLGGITAIASVGIVLAMRWQRVSPVESIGATVPMLRGRIDASVRRDITLAAAQVVGWGGVFGVALGAYAGGWQMIFLPLKVPLLFLCALLVSAVTMMVLLPFFGVDLPRKRILALIVRSLAVTATMLAACAPIVLFLEWLPQSHDQLLFSSLGIFTLAGLAGLGWLARQLRRAGARQAIVATVLVAVLYGGVLLQVGWLLRPWVGALDPLDRRVPFSRLYSGNVFVELGNALERIKK